MLKRSPFSAWSFGGSAYTLQARLAALKYLYHNYYNYPGGRGLPSTKGSEVEGATCSGAW